MNITDFLRIYKEDAVVQVVAEKIKPNSDNKIQLKGLTGSQDAVLLAALHANTHQNFLVVLHDKEEAAYFHNDMQNLMSHREILFYPTSYKRPYEFEEIENANILMRAEILNRINHKLTTGEIIVSYPEALTEKVINKQSLSNNTYSINIGDEVNPEFLTEILNTYGFEKTDFVYEAGQFAIRGGIIDVFSYAHDLPYRIELFGDDVESIREFDPENQLSKNEVKKINIIPNVQTRLLQEKRQSFLEFLPKNTKIFFKDVEMTFDILDKYFEKATSQFENILKASQETKIVLQPEDVFENSKSFISNLDKYTQIEFGRRFFYQTADVFEFQSEPQPSFNKNFDLLAQNLDENQAADITNIIVADSAKQLEKLRTIFEEIDPFMNYRELNTAFRQGFIDKDLKLACYTDHQLFERFHRYKTKNRSSKSKALTLKEVQNLQPGDYVTHIDYGIGRFAGLDKVDIIGKEQEALRLIYRDDDLLYVSIHSLHKISKYTGKEGSPPIISKLGTQEWENKKRKAKKKVKDIAKDLIQLYAKRKETTGYAFTEDGYMQAELETSFLYEDTPDQAKSTADVKVDMEAPHPMDRLVCGDVGFGKTEVAIRAAFKAVTDGKQVAVLVPTTILAFQHYRTFMERLKGMPVSIEYVNRFRSTQSIREILKNVTEGKVDILIGTHRIVSKDVQFKDLGLLVIDEEQKFGVKVKEKLKEFRVNVDVLTLTATPIPRTLHFSLMGARDLSVIATPPPNRQPVTTEIHTFNENIIRDAISFELRRGGQVFFVHNRIKDIEQVGNIILKLVPDARIGIAHGQIDGSKLEKVMLKFIEGGYDVLVSTNIIESGLDIPNANTIIINQAHMFGLSDLHQMRGRVGRSNKKAFCYLLSPPTIGLTSDARKRLSTLEEFSDLGDGFKVAMRDLDIRGAGNLLGAEQSGFINDLGFDTYHKILDEAVQELKETDFKDLFKQELEIEKLKRLVPDCNIETDLEILIPEDYVSNISERLSFYNTLDNVPDEEKLQEVINSMRDRFGPIPGPVEDLIKIVRIRWKAEQLGIEKLLLKNGSMKAYFVSADNAEFYNSYAFGSILKYVQRHPRLCRLKEMTKRVIFIVDEAPSVEDASTIFEQILTIKSLLMQ
ncbi:MAG TPA: transcription-repair coupling factor [Cytophagales bacterium]|nr:transcription-repair coupling factor [Cytophagales bacterium]